MRSFIDEFKKFILRGNFVDLAVGIVIGTAFGKIVESLVRDIFMPLVGLAHMIGFRGRCSFIMYLPSKPDKYGIKVFCTYLFALLLSA